MTHVTCRLAAKNRGISSGNLRSAVEYGPPLPFLASPACCCWSCARQDGLIRTDVVYSILLQSGLRRDVLGYIWDMCNRATPGQLIRQELFLMLAMISVAQVSLLTRAVLFDIAHVEQGLLGTRLHCVPKK